MVKQGRFYTVFKTVKLKLQYFVVMIWMDQIKVFPHLTIILKFFTSVKIYNLLNPADTGRICRVICNNPVSAALSEDPEYDPH